MRKRLALVLTPVLLLAMLPGAVLAGGPGSSDGARHNNAVAFWTGERLAAATPRDIVFDPVRGYHPAAKPPGTPGGGGGGGGGGGVGGNPIPDVTGASWTAGGDVLKGTGKVFFALSSGIYQCSATLVTDGRAGHALALTAAHCVYDKGKFATNWIFIPDYDTAPAGYGNCGTTVHGCWTAQALFLHGNFAAQKRFNTTAVTHDFAFALLGPGGKNGTTQLNTVIGSGFGIAFDGPALGAVLAAYGYPAGAPYGGTDLSYCKGGIGTDANTSNATWAMACDMTGGSSGGGWLDGDWTNFPSFPAGSGPGGSGGARLRSLNSYGYSGIDNMYGPKLNSRALAVYNAANGTATTNQLVSGG